MKKKLSLKTKFVLLMWKNYYEIKEELKNLIKKSKLL